jgi:hypothetical protein
MDAITGPDAALGALLALLTSPLAFAAAAAASTVDETEATRQLTSLLFGGLLFAVPHTLQAAFLLHRLAGERAAPVLRELRDRPAEAPALRRLCSLLLAGRASEVAAMTPQQYLAACGDGAPSDDAGGAADESARGELPFSLPDDPFSADPPPPPPSGSSPAAVGDALRSHPVQLTPRDAPGSLDLDLRAELEAAAREPLLPAREAAATAALRRRPRAVLELDLPPVWAAEAAAHNPLLAAEALAALTLADADGGAAALAAWALCSAPPSLGTLTAVAKATERAALPPDAVAAFAAAAAAWVAGMADASQGARMARMLCRALSAMAARDPAYVALAAAELEPFCLAFSRLAEAAALYAELTALRRGG